MINFYIQFLICFSKPTAPPKKETAKKKDVKVTKSLKKEESTRKPSEKNEQNENNQDGNDETVKCTENARHWCHIEYSLFEDVLPKIEINVVTWGAAAKVYFQDDCRAIKTVMKDDVVWVYFSVIHKINELSNEEVEKFKDTSIMFKFSQDQSKMMNSAANDWPKEFVICKKVNVDLESENWFLELRQTEPLDETHRGSLKERLENYKVDRPQKHSVVSMLQVSPCQRNIETKITEITPILPKEVQPQETKGKKDDKKAKKGKPIGSKENKDKEANESDGDKSQLFLKSELLIAGLPNVCVEQINVSPSLKYVGFLANSSKILTSDQDNTFVPLTVTIQSVEDLPLSFIRKYKVKNIYARYELANVLDNIETGKVPLVRKNLTLDDTRVFFLGLASEKLFCPELMLRSSVLSLAEALLTHKFVVKLYGETDGVKETIVEPRLFGELQSDPFISTPGHEMFLNYKPPPVTSTEVFLGSACFSLIQLIKGYYKVEEYSILTSDPVSSWDPTCDVEEIIEQMKNKTDRETLLSRFTVRGLIPEPLLLEHCTRIKIKISIGCELVDLTADQLSLMPDICHRLIIIFKNDMFAKNFFQRITLVNLMNVGPSKVSLLTDTISTIMKMYSPRQSSSLRPNLSSRQSSSLNPLHSRLRLSSAISYIQHLQLRDSRALPAITGFYIENEEESILAVEANAYILSSVIEPLYGIFPEDGRIIYDSSLFFTKRLYRGFDPLSIYRIKLSTPLNELLKKCSYYNEKSPTELALQTLLLLDLLRRSRTMHCVCVNQLFPSCDQLVSFNNEFGEAEDSSTNIHHFH